ncbi:GDSL-type esterase/lipase family protein [Candidatus Latescibacterota bacterium]
MRKRSFILWMFIFFITAVTDSSAQTDSDEKAHYPDPVRFEAAVQTFEAADLRNTPPEGAVVCTGSSSMRGWHKTIGVDLDPLTIIPRGFGGSNMNDLLYFAERIVIKYKPRAVVIYEGDNDIASGISPAEIRDTFNAFTAKVHEHLPETRIYFLTIKPSIKRVEMWPRMKEANGLIAAECEENSLLTYIDVSTPMLDDSGNVMKDIFLADDLHMNESGYEIWTGAARPILIKNELEFERNVR